jgi:hypothetical protein
MLSHLLRNASVRDVVKLCSPALFSVLSTRSVLAEVGKLSASRDLKHHDALVQAHTPMHARHGLVVEQRGVGRSLAEGAELPASMNAKTVGEAVLQTYFRELLGFDDMLIDLRPSSMYAEATQLMWVPAPMSVAWHPEFVRPLRGVYVGFYQDDDPLFQSSLSELGLLPAQALFRQHFGDGDQRAVQFSTREFTHTFSNVFEACARAGSQLHSNFLPFGFALASLFQTLERLGGAFDVRSAFETAQRQVT